MTIEIIIVGAAVALAVIVLGRHVLRESQGRGGSCADCCERCTHRSQCSLITIKTGVNKREATADQAPGDR